MTGISTHILNTSRGLPAPGVEVTLERLDPRPNDPAPAWAALSRSRTDADGRVKALLPPGHALAPATYRLRFDTAAYFAAAGTEPFFPHVEIVFTVSDPARHHHVPLLLSPFAYSTYRGS